MVKKKLILSVGWFVRCEAFPLVIMTSNAERDFPPSFLRRCLRLHLEPPNEDKLRDIVTERLGPNSEHKKQVDELLAEFLEQRDGKSKEIATDQLLNAVYSKNSINRI